jgi:hypothetical protein
MIILQCITEKKKLRIRFFCYIDNENKYYYNVYNNDYNCQFPRDIREEGRFYQVGDDDIHLIYDGSKAPFYKISKNNIKVLSTDEGLMYLNKKNNIEYNLSELKIYEISECVICMSEPSSVIFIPCAHRATCNDCYQGLKKVNNCCPLCRRHIHNFIT